MMTRNLYVSLLSMFSCFDYLSFCTSLHLVIHNKTLQSKYRLCCDLCNLLKMAYPPSDICQGVFFPPAVSGLIKGECESQRLRFALCSWAMGKETRLMICRPRRAVVLTSDQSCRATQFFDSKSVWHTGGMKIIVVPSEGWVNCRNKLLGPYLLPRQIPVGSSVTKTPKDQIYFGNNHLH